MRRGTAEARRRMLRVKAETVQIQKDHWTASAPGSGLSTVTPALALAIGGHIIELGVGPVLGSARTSLPTGGARDRYDGAAV